MVDSTPRRPWNVEVMQVNHFKLRQGGLSGIIIPTLTLQMQPARVRDARGEVPTSHLPPPPSDTCRFTKQIQILLTRNEHQQLPFTYLLLTDYLNSNGSDSRSFCR